MNCIPFSSVTAFFFYISSCPLHRKHSRRTASILAILSATLYFLFIFQVTFPGNAHAFVTLIYLCDSSISSQMHRLPPPSPGKINKLETVSCARKAGTCRISGPFCKKKNKEIISLSIQLPEEKHGILGSFFLFPFYPGVLP